MSLNPEIPLGLARIGRHAALAFTAAALAAGCSLTGPPPARSRAAEIVPRISIALPATVASSPQSPEPIEPVQPAASTPTAEPPSQTALTRLLAYSERLRSMPAAELGPEAARLGGPGESGLPASQMQLALILGQTRQLPDLVRAHELVTRVLANSSADAQPLHGLARLLALRFGEQRRLEDQLDKERQQSRELQKKLDQTNERLEALKAIERSLTTRPPPVPPAPAAASSPPAAPASAPARRRPSAP